MTLHRDASRHVDCNANRMFAIEPQILLSFVAPIVALGGAAAFVWQKRRRRSR